jgi:hypothetical protein
MSKRTRYHVTPGGNDWKIQRGGSSRASARFETKAQALSRAREMARNSGAQLFIHGRDGKIQEERTYPRSSDPHPPSG